MDPKHGKLLVVLWLPSRTSQYDPVVDVITHQSIDHGEIKLVFTWKLHPYWIAFFLLAGAMPAVGGENNS